MNNYGYGLRYNGLTGTLAHDWGDIMTPINQELSETEMDKLLARLMVHTQKVILPCRYCGSHNAFSNPSCIKCGAPMGVSYA